MPLVANSTLTELIFTVSDINLKINLGPPIKQNNLSMSLSSSQRRMSYPQSQSKFFRRLGAYSCVVVMEMPERNARAGRGIFILDHGSRELSGHRGM